MKLLPHYSACLGVFLFLVLFSCQKPEKSTGLEAAWLIDSLSLWQPQDSGTLVREQNSFVFVPQKESQCLLRTLDDTLSKPYIIIDARYEGNACGVFYLKMFRKGNTDLARHDFFYKIGILPGINSRITIPLDFLDAQDVYLPRYPGQLKGFANGLPMLRSDVAAMAISLGAIDVPDQWGKLTVSRILYSDSVLPQPDPGRVVVDRYGRWKEASNQVVITADESLKSYFDSLLTAYQNKETLPGLSKYGGLLSKKLKATGFFSTQYDGKRWWFVDPEGYAMLSVGQDGVRPVVNGPVNGFESWFEALPERNDSTLKSIFNEAMQANTSRPVHKQLSVNFMMLNFIKAYGVDSAFNQWTLLNKNVLRSMGFNTIGNWSDMSFIKKAQMPYVHPLKAFPETKTLLFRDFPDVYSPEYEMLSQEFALQLDSLKHDPYLIGYFMRNEPLWAFAEATLNPCLEMLTRNIPSVTRDTLVLFLKNRYAGRLDEFKTCWGLPSVDEVKTLWITDRNKVSKEAQEDMYEFSIMMVKKYVSVPALAVKKIDPNHLNLGMRYAWISTPLLYHAGEMFDVFSLNGYSYPGPPETEEITRITGKPVMIGEFHHGALDGGTPATGIQGVATQKDRGDAYRAYVELGFARPELIGIHHFVWNDQLITGRFDGENYNCGFVDVLNCPYTELENAARQTHEVMYEVAKGKKKPYNKLPKYLIPVFY